MAGVFVKLFNIKFNYYFLNQNFKILSKEANFPWDNLLFYNLNFYFKTNDFTNKIFINLLKNNYYNYSLINLLNFTNFFFLYEIVANKAQNIINISVLFNCFITNLNLIYLINIKNKIKSISNIYPSSIWIERELKEMNNIFFIDLKDSRRLLTDYFQFEQNFNCYKTTSYFNKNQIVLKRCYIDYISIHIFYYAYCLV